MPNYALPVLSRNIGVRQYLSVARARNPRHDSVEGIDRDAYVQETGRRLNRQDQVPGESQGADQDPAFACIGLNDEIAFAFVVGFCVTSAQVESV